MPVLSNMNGHIPNQGSEEYIDRRISNMLSFKSDLKKINDNNSENKDNKEVTMPLELSDGRLRNYRDLENTEDSMINQGDLSNSIPRKNSLRIETASPMQSFRRKSIQIVNKILLKDEEENMLENKRMDDQNSEGDCKASPLDVFRYPNLRKKFFILTFNWVALGVVYNSLSYNSPNLGVDDYLAFFIGEYCYYVAKYIILLCFFF